MSAASRTVSRSSSNLSLRLLLSVVEVSRFTDNSYCFLFPQFVAYLPGLPQYVSESLFSVSLFPLDSPRLPPVNFDIKPPVLI